MNPVKLLAFGAAGVAVWWFFLRAPGTAAVATVAPSTSAKSAGSLDAAFAAMVRKANGATSGSVDDWNAWLMQGTPSITAPDPMPIFQAAISGFDRSRRLSAAEYWAVMSPVMKTQYGLSGLGLFGAMAQARRGRY